MYVCIYIYITFFLSLSLSLYIYIYVSIFVLGIMWSSFPPCSFVRTYCFEQQVFEIFSIYCSTFKYTLEDNVESVSHTRFDFMWEIIMISL